MIVEHTTDPGGSYTAIYHPELHALAAAGTPPRTPTVELRGIVSEGGECFAFITDGRFNWTVRCKPTDLQSFTRFQAAAAKELGIWIGHDSQGELRAGWRKGAWNDAVSAAFARGKAAG